MSGDISGQQIMSIEKYIMTKESKIRVQHQCVNLVKGNKLSPLIGVTQLL
jgi:hypothetical protein